MVAVYWWSYKLVWNRDTQQEQTPSRRLQESLQGTNREHKGKYKGWWKQETYKGVQEQEKSRYPKWECA